jgi:hypothetical protein
MTRKRLLLLAALMSPAAFVGMTFAGVAWAQTMGEYAAVTANDSTAAKSTSNNYAPSPDFSADRFATQNRFCSGERFEDSNRFKADDGSFKKNPFEDQQAFNDSDRFKTGASGGDPFKTKNFDTPDRFKDSSRLKSDSFGSASSGLDTSMH